MKTCLYSFILTLLLLSIKVCTGLSQQVFFKNMLNTAIGSNITDITQDPLGVMWFTSTAGLNRYDGYSVTTYSHDPLNPNSLHGQRVECVYADNHGIIWIGYLGWGLDRFDPSTGVFTNYHHNPKDPNSINHDFVTAIYEDKDDNLWIGTHGGLNKLDRKRGKFTSYAHKDNDSTTISDDQVRVIYQDRQGTLWIGTGSPFVGVPEDLPGATGIEGEGGLNKMDIKTGKFTRYMHNPNDPHSLINNKVRAIFEDSRGTFWVGTAGDGLHTMDRKTGSFQRYAYDPLHPEKLSRSPVNKEALYDHITFITEDISGRIWIGTCFGGISCYDQTTKKIKHYNNDTLSGFTDNGVFGHCISRDGLLWVTTWKGNLFTISPFSSTISHYPENSPISFYFDKNILWMGTDSAGLIMKDLKQKSIKQFPFKGAIYHLDKDNKDNLWIPTSGYGLVKLNTQTQAFSHCKHIDTAKNCLMNDTVYTVYVDKLQNIWAGTEKGLDKLDSRTGRFTHYQHMLNDTSSIMNDRIYCIREDKNGDLWIGFGGGEGIDKMDTRTGKCKHYLYGESILSIVRSYSGDLLAGSFDGLYKFDTDRNDFTRIVDPVTGKDFSGVTAIVEDEQHNLWFSEATGIVRLNIKNNESFTFGKNAGVDPKSIHIFSGYKDAHGGLYFGNTSGYYTFNPSNLATNAKPPEILFTNFSFGNQSVKPTGNGPLKTEIWKTKEITAKYNQNIFSFEFIPIDYNNPIANQAFYKLENYDNEWRTATNPGKAYYFNVPPGKYVFRVKASNSFGVWAEKDIAIIINSPWWSTWWAYFMYALLAVAGIWTIVHYRSRSLRRELEQRKKEQQLVELRHQKSELEMHALRAQMNPHFIFNSLNSIDLFILQNDKAKASKYLTKFSRLIRMILDSSTKATVSLAEDLEALQLYLELERLRCDQKFSFRIKCDPGIDADFMQLPPMLLQPFAENAIWHGLMNKKEGGHLCINIDQEDSTLICTITDDGIGRKKAAELQDKSDKHKSMGMKITEGRIAMIQKMSEENKSVEIRDLVDADDNAAGTEVVLKIPVVQL
jgi:ligand-binding sensor domain-containing protein